MIYSNLFKDGRPSSPKVEDIRTAINTLYVSVPPADNHKNAMNEAKTFKDNLSEAERIKSRITKSFPEYGRLKFYVDYVIFYISISHALARFIELINSIQFIQE